MGEQILIGVMSALGVLTLLAVVVALVKSYESGQPPGDAWDEAHRGYVDSLRRPSRAQAKRDVLARLDRLTAPYRDDDPAVRRAGVVRQQMRDRALLTLGDDDEAA